VGRVAQILKAILVGAACGLFAHHDIFDHHCSLWGTHTHHFAQHARRLFEVMER
jgi:hypothetical protein